MYIPMNYDTINLMDGTTNPSTDKYVNNYSYNMWFRSLFQRTISNIDIQNMPDNWRGDAKSYIYYVLFSRGFGAVAKNDKYGLFFQHCTLSGIGFYYQPTKAIITNPLLTTSEEYEIGKDCEIVKLTPDYQGVFDIIDNYARKLALLETSIDVNLINSKTPYILGGKTKGAIQALKKITDKMNNGYSSIYFDSRIANTNKDDEVFIHLDLFDKNKYIVSDLLEDFRTLINNFDAEIGIKNVNYEKKERLLSDEVNANNGDSIARCILWVETLNNSFEKVNAMFGTNLKAEIRLNDEDLTNESSEDNSNRVL